MHRTSFFVSSPPSAAATPSALVVPTAENRLEYRHFLLASGLLPPDRIGRILHVVELCRPVLR
jgi:hypothetical protein